MTSQINPGTINVNYPVPGVNNSTQGFRDNFAATKNNFSNAAAEISDLQSKVVVKSALTGTAINNDMANTLISNALVQGFRSTTYNLGSNLTGAVSVDLTLGDLQYGTLTGNITLSFAKWPPTNTYSRVDVVLTVIPGQTITLPASVTAGLSTIEGRNALVITIPAGVTRVHYTFTSIDCGTNIEIIPVDRPRNGIISNAPATAASAGTAGQVAYDSGYIYICVATNTWKRAALSTW